MARHATCLTCEPSPSHAERCHACLAANQRCLGVSLGVVRRLDSPDGQRAECGCRIDPAYVQGARTRQADHESLRKL